MHSWVRYSVSAYLGLLVAGSIATPELGDPNAPTPVASLRENTDTERYYLVPMYYAPQDESMAAPDSAES